METLNETQTQNKNATSLWQTIGMYIGMMVGFLYPQIGLGLGMLLGIALGRLVLTKIPVNTPTHETGNFLAVHHLGCRPLEFHPGFYRLLLVHSTRHRERGTAACQSNGIQP